MDEEQKTITPEETTPPTEPSSANPEVEQAPSQEEPESQVESSQPEGAPVKPVEKRIHKLVDERDRERERAESLARQVEALTDQLSGQPQASMPQSTLEPGAEITPEQYRADVARQAQAITQMELQKERIINRVNKEAMESMKAHPELDPSSDSFDKELSDTVSETVKAQFLANPNASVTRLVNQMMKPYRKAVDKKVAQQTEVITKQASESAIRPSQVKVGETPFEKLSQKEMEEKLGIVS
jgi:hypothetical protein